MNLQRLENALPVWYTPCEGMYIRKIGVASDQKWVTSCLSQECMELMCSKS
jgi:hypothetical protein